MLSGPSDGGDCKGAGGGDSWEDKAQQFKTFRITTTSLRLNDVPLVVPFRFPPSQAVHGQKVQMHLSTSGSNAVP